jgi:sugar (pentulose or hexulose) kinase
MRKVVLGIDAGTSNVKSIAVTLDGAERFHASRENEVLTPQTGWAEQDMTATWERTAETVREVVASLGDDDEIIAVGVTGQGDGCWPMDADGEPVGNAILWSDGRAADIVREWEANGTAAAIRDRCGCDLFPGAPVAILRWLADNEPGRYDGTDTAFACKDWIKYRLTDTVATDPTEVGLPYLDLETDDYYDVDAVTGLDGVNGKLAPIVAPSEVVGRVTDAAAAATGIPVDTPVASGVFDVIASGYGSGAVRPGDSSSVVGTTSLNQTVLDGVPETLEGSGFTFSLGGGRYLRTFASMAGTPNVDWLSERLTAIEDLDELEELAASVPPGAEGVLYHPYLSGSGERAPFLKTTARAQFVGLSPDHTRANVVRAVYEGVALAMRDCFEYIPAESDRVLMSGGGTRSELWCQMFSDCLDTPVSIPEGTEFGAKGVALLAAVAVGEFPDIETAVEETTTVERTYRPDPEAAETYDVWYDVYREVYEAMFDVWDVRADALERMG